MIKLILACILSLPAAGPAFAEEEVFKPESLAPSSIPPGRPALAELTAGLRAKVKKLPLNGLPGPKGGKVSKALLLLPRDRARAGALSFEIETGKQAGVYQCEALGRGLTSSEPKPRWPGGFIGDTAIYYAPKEIADGVTVPGVYDLRNISPELYEIVFLNKPEDLAGEEGVVARRRERGCRCSTGGRRLQRRKSFPGGQNSLRTARATIPGLTAAPALPCIRTAGRTRRGRGTRSTPGGRRYRISGTGTPTAALSCARPASNC